MVSNNLHAGHRRRIIERFLVSPQGFSEHEILEIALFFAIPRKNTNDLAHKLISTFKNIKGVLSATPEQLMTVKGVGKAVAQHIQLLGKLVEASKEKLNSNTNNYNYINFERTKQLLINRMKEYSTESFLMILLDDKYNEVGAVEYRDDRPFKVTAELSELVNAINVFKPDKILIAHNHVESSQKPSVRDDIATLKLSLLCDMHAIRLLDHVIVFENECYSYFQEMRLDYIKNSAHIENIFKQKENQIDVKS